MTTQGPIDQAPPQADELTLLAESIFRDQRRIVGLQNPAPAVLATEMAGTLLAYDRDIASYLSRFEQSVIANFQAVFEMLHDLQENGPAGDEGGTQFEPADAAKFRDFITGARVLLVATGEALGTSEQVKQQVARMVQVADQLLALIDESTLEEDDGEDEEGDGEEQVVAQGNVALGSDQ